VSEEYKPLVVVFGYRADGMIMCSVIQTEPMLSELLKMLEEWRK